MLQSVFVLYKYCIIEVQLDKEFILTFQNFDCSFI